MLGRFTPLKAAQASAVVLKSNQPPYMSRLRLLKLLYIAEPEALQETGRTITGDTVLAMDNGPVLNRTYHLIQGADNNSSEWDRCIRRVDPRDVELIADPGSGELSLYEMEKLQAVAQRFDLCDDWELAEYTQKFEEWIKNRPERCFNKPIPMDSLLDAVGMLQHKNEIMAEIQAGDLFDQLLAEAHDIKRQKRSQLVNWWIGPIH